MIAPIACGDVGLEVTAAVRHPGNEAKVKLSRPVVALVPLAVVTVTCTVPGACAGLTALTWESDTNVKLAAAVAPNDTPSTPVNPQPLIVTLVAPAAGPVLGETPLTVGAPPRP